MFRISAPKISCHKIDTDFHRLGSAASHLFNPCASVALLRFRYFGSSPTLRTILPRVWPVATRSCAFIASESETVWAACNSH